MKECPDITFKNNQEILDEGIRDCSTCKEDSLYDVNNPGYKYKLGSAFHCDPKTTGEIVNSINKNPNRKIINKYPLAVKSLVEGMEDLFSNIVVLDEEGNQHKVPILFASRERAVDFITQENVRKDNTGVVDRITLPIMSLWMNSFAFASDRYTYHWAEMFFNERMSELRKDDTAFKQSRGIPVDIGFQLDAWTYFIEDMLQILESVALKFSPIAYIRTRGNKWITAVKLDSIDQNVDLEPGNTNLRMIKFTFNFTAEHYIPQPASRYKTVLQERIDITNGLEDRDVTDFISRILIKGEDAEC